MSSIESESKFIPDYEDYKSQSISPIPIREELNTTNTLDDVSDIEIEDDIWTTVDEYKEEQEVVTASSVEAMSLEEKPECIPETEKSSIEASSLVRTTPEDGMIITITDTGRTIQSTPLLKDLRIDMGRSKQQLQKEINRDKSATGISQHQPLGPSGDVEPKTPHFTVIVPTNTVPRGISYASLPGDMLPPNGTEFHIWWQHISKGN